MNTMNTALGLLLISTSAFAGTLPTATITASAKSIVLGQKVTLSWSTSGATSVEVIQYSEDAGQILSTAHSGSMSITPNASYYYTVYATNSAGGTWSNKANVNFTSGTSTVLGLAIVSSPLTGEFAPSPYTVTVTKGYSGTELSNPVAIAVGEVPIAASCPFGTSASGNFMVWDIDKSNEIIAYVNFTGSVNETVELPSSGHLYGVQIQCDNSRGVEYDAGWMILTR
jgi:hypothetical protein